MWTRSKVFSGQMMKTFICEEENFKCHSRFDGKPVEKLLGVVDVLSGFCATENPVS